MSDDSGVVEVRVPHENVNDETVTILAWKVADGDRVQAEQPLAEVETSKATFDVRSPVAGVVRTAAPAGREIPVGAILCYIGESAEAITRKLGASAAVETQAAPEVRQETRIGPKALALIRQHGLSESLFIGRGLVTEQDVLKHLDQKDSPRAAAPSAGFTPLVPTEAKALPRSKRLEAKVLGWSHSHTLPSLVTVSVPRSSQLNDERTPGYLGMISAAIIAETAKLLRKYPALNAFHADGTMHVYKQVNIGFAIDAGQGLKVPVVHDADAKTLQQVMEEKQSLIIAYLENQILPEQLSGATFTITDLSGEQVSFFQPLINQGQSAILGVGAAANGAYNLILAFDHQLADGRMAAQFLTELRDRMVEYERSLLPADQTATMEPACEYCFKPLSELRTLRRHLLKAVAGPDGREKMICSICLEGW